MNDRSFRLSDVSHSWPSTGVRACQNVNLTIGPGEVQALVGENGAGKTTLAHILAGVQRPDTGILEINSQCHNLASRGIGLIPGTALVRQRSIWPGSLRVWEASVLGRERQLKGWRSRDWIAELRRTAARWNLIDFDPGVPVFSLDAGARQRAELVASLLFQPSILVLDEPASAWEEGRAREFFPLISRLKDAGIAILLVTHRLSDVFRIADRVTAMRHGYVTGSWRISEIDNSTLIRSIFGEAPDPTNISDSGVSGVHDIEFPIEIILPENRKELSLRNVCLIEAGKTRLDNVSFRVESGEILAIAGLREEGLSVLEDIVSGNRKPTGGELSIGDTVMNGNPPGMRRAGLSYVPSDKTGRGASMSSTLAENMLLLEAAHLSRGGWLSPSRVRKWAEKRRSHASINGKPDQELQQLSGGNIQKVILQRELAGNPPLLTLADPAWGLDERSKKQLYRILRNARARGSAILLLASDLDEAFELSDRLGILSRGSLSPIRPTGEWTRSQATDLISNGTDAREPVNGPVI